MFLSKSFAVYWLLYGAIGLARHMTRADESLRTAAFVVGPEPQPLVFRTGEGVPHADDRRMNNIIGDPVDAIPKPLPRVPVQEFAKNGDRKLDGRRSEGRNGRFLQDDACSITNTILGFNFTDNIAENGAAVVPAHPMGAVGVSRLVATVYSMLEVRQKDGTLLFRDGLKRFFSDFPEASNPGTAFLVPRVIYDEHAGRFVVTASQRGYTPKVSRIWMAVSKDETPDTGSGWYKSFINSTVSERDGDSYALSTGLEVDEEVVYVTTSTYFFSDNGIRDAVFWVIKKGLPGGFYDGGTLSSYSAAFDPNFRIIGRMIPTQVHGASGVDGSVGTYFVYLRSPSTELVELRVFTLFNPESANPTYSTQTVSLGAIHEGLFVLLPDAPQLGTKELINTNNAEALDAVWRNNKLWVVFNVNATSGANRNQTTAHWVRLGTSGGTLTLEAQGDLGGEDIAVGTYTYYPSVAVNSRGVVAYGYGASSPTTYAGAYASVGTSEQSYTVKNGLAPYKRLRETRNRWGGYSGIAVDPTDDSFWVFNQYADTVGSAGSDGDGRWGTAWGRLACAVRFRVPFARIAPRLEFLTHFLSDRY